MMDWFKAGGFGMFVILAIGAGAIGVSVKALLNPTAERIATLRSLPTLILTTALFTFGTDLWTVATHLESESFAKTFGVTDAEKPFIGLLGLCEASQALTLGGLMAAAVVVLRMVAEARESRKAKGVAAVAA